MRKLYTEKNQLKEGKGHIDIFAVLGHDLKSPLNAVEQYLEILRTRVLGESIDPYLPIVEKSIVRLHQMRELITDVVDWAKIEAPDRERSLTELDITRAAGALVDELRKEAQARHIVIESEIEEALTMRGVAWEIDLILRHLLTNAVKYNKDGGRVAVSLKRVDSRLAVSVTDTGIGLTADEQARIFHEFVRIKKRETQDIRGTGLGLAIVKQLADLYGGTVSIKSEENKGSTFLVSLCCGD